MKIEQILVGDVSLPPAHPRSGEAYPIFGYLIHHPAGPVLVDTGVTAGHPQIDAAFAPAAIPIEEALRKVGVAPRDVVMVVNTHLHFDHAGQNHRFPGVPVVAQVAEHKAAQQPGYTINEWIDYPDVVWRLVDGRHEILPGIVVVPTRSHTPGHQAIVVTSATATTVIAGQALHNREELEAARSFEGLDPAGPDSFRAVAELVKAMDPDRVWFSHDARPWRRPQESSDARR